MLKRTVFILSIVLCSIALFAQDVEFTASVSPARVQVGQQFQYTVQGNKQGDVKLPDTPEIKFLYGPSTGFRQNSSWVNGKMQSNTIVTYTYVAVANQAGEVVIPPAKVKIRKNSFETNEVTVNVIEGNSSGQSSTNGAGSGTVPVSSGSNATAPQGESTQDVKLEIQPAKRNVYVGEQFVSDLRIYTRVNTRPVGGLNDVVYDGFYKKAIDPDQTAQQLGSDSPYQLTQVISRNILIPQKSGELVIPAHESEWTIPKRVQRKRSNDPFDAFFNDPFFDRVQEVPTKILTKPVTIKVKPLPYGAPAGFNGAVGSFKMNASLTEDKITVNDALNLKITISGTGNLALIGEPKVDFPPDHDIYETTKSLSEKIVNNKITGSVTFEYPIVARHAGKFRIAPVEFSWFDPVDEEYKTISSEEFTFIVEKGENEEGQQTQIYMPNAHGEEVQNIGTDIIDIERTLPEFTVKGKSPLASFGYWLFYLIFMLIFVALIIVLQIRNKYREDVNLTRNRKANKIAKNRMRVADKARNAKDADVFFEETEKAIWGYLADKLSIDQSDLSKDKVSEMLQELKLKEELEQQLLRIIDDCEYSRYAPSSEKSDMDQLYNDAIKLINKLEQNIKVK